MKEIISILRHLTFRRIWNVALLWLSFLYSRMRKKPFMWGNPMALSLEPTTSCNLRCPECPSGLRSFTRQTGMLTYDRFTHMIDQFEDSLIYLNLYFQGEPYLNPDLFQMIKYATGKNIYTVSSTNAHFLNDEKSKATVLSGLNQLIISIDGIDQKTYEQYRIGGDLEKVLEGTRQIIEWKRKLKMKLPYLIYQCLLFRFNESQIERMKSLALETGVDEIRFKTAQIYDFNKKQESIPDNPEYSRYRLGKDGKYHIQNPLENHCWRMWSSCVVTWDGKVVPCCFDKDAVYTMGDLSEEDFQGLWKNKTYNRFRKQILNSRTSIDICSNCTEGTKVWA